MCATTKTLGRNETLGAKSGRGQPHSMTCRNVGDGGASRSVIECGCPLPLSSSGGHDTYIGVLFLQRTPYHNE